MPTEGKGTSPGQVNHTPNSTLEKVPPARDFTPQTDS